MLRRCGSGVFSVALFMALVLPSQSFSAGEFANGDRVLEGIFNGCTSSGTTNTYACSLGALFTVYRTNSCYTFVADSANTGAAEPTINFSSVGAKIIKKVTGGITTALSANDIRLGQVVGVCYDGTNMQMQSTLGNAASGSGSGTITPGAVGNVSYYPAAAATVNPSSGLTFNATKVLTRFENVTVPACPSIALGAQDILYITTGGSNCTATLPAASGATVGHYKLIKEDAAAGNIILAVTGTDTLNKVTSGTRTITDQNETMEVDWVSTTGWHVITAKVPLLVCMITIGAENGAALGNPDLGPLLQQCMIPYAATVKEITVYADAGTPNVMVHHRTGTTNTALLSNPLATAASGALACAKTTAVAGVAGTTCAATLQNTSVAAGDTIGLTSGTAGGTAKRVSVAVTLAGN